MRLKNNWSWKQFNLTRRRFQRFEPYTYSVGSSLGIQLIPIGTITLLLTLAGVNPVYISFGIFLFLFSTSLCMVYIYRGFIKMRHIYLIIVILSFLALMLHVLYLSYLGEKTHRT